MSWVQASLVDEMKFKFTPTYTDEDFSMTTMTFWEPRSRVDDFIENLSELIADDPKVRLGDLTDHKEAYVLEVWVLSSDMERIKRYYRRAGIAKYNHLKI